MDDADLRKKTKTNAFADFLSGVITTEQASKVSAPPHLPPTPQKMRRGTKTAVTSASVTATTPTSRLNSSNMNLRNKNVLRRKMMKKKFTMKIMISLRMRRVGMVGKMSVL